MRVDIYVGRQTAELVIDPRKIRKFEALIKPVVSAEVDGARFTWDFKSGAWDGKVSLFNKEVTSSTARYIIQAGLLPSVLEILRPKCKLSIQDNRQLITPSLGRTSIKLRPYQHEAITTAFANTVPEVGWWPRGVLHVATGGGKTEMAVAMYEMYTVPTLFLVHRKDLLKQAVKRFNKYGHNPGIVGDSVFKPDPNLTIATMQTIYKITSAPDDSRGPSMDNLLRNCDQVFFDEAHVMASTVEKGNMFCSIANKLGNATCRWGLTATPFMRQKYDNLLLESVTGGVLYSITNAELIELGYLTPPIVRLLKVPGKMIVKKPTKRSNKAAAEYWRRINDQGIKFNVPRNELIADELMKGQGPILCLVKTIEQGKLIQKLVQQKGGSSIPLVTGKDGSDVRAEAIEDMQSGKLYAVISTVFDIGVNIPELRKVIIGSGGKSVSALLQNLGRGLRIAAGKTKVEIVDFSDRHHIKLKQHADARRKVYNDEGFKIE